MGEPVHLVMFDVDGTILESYDFDSECFRAAIYDVLGMDVEPDWDGYKHVTDSGILCQILDGSGVSENRNSIAATVKSRFIERISSCIAEQGVTAVSGSVEFICSLQERPDVTLAIATGGWIETARLKLESAGFKLDGITIASGSDHYDRVKIMETAELRTNCGVYESRTYLGDRAWDLQAASSLGYRFVAVGGAIEHPLSIPDFEDLHRALRAVGL